MNPKYPIFIPTKGRYKNPMTIKAFEKLDIPYKAVVEHQEYRKYKAIIDRNKILVLPHQNEGLTMTRNWIWDYALSLGVDRFWTFDDNIREFYRLNKNIKWRVDSGTFLKVIEDFVDRYENIYIAGMQYELFVPRKTKTPPYILNTRVYSNMLIKTDIPYRNECFYNDDTDLCLRVLKDKYCTILFQAFLADKMATMRMKGGMTDYYEKTDERLQFAEELVAKHPDVAKITWKFNRWHHQVDYSKFKRNKLIKKSGVIIPQGINNYGMVLKTMK